MAETKRTLSILAQRVVSAWQAGASGPEIAQQMSLTRGQVNGHISRARAAGYDIRSAVNPVSGTVVTGGTPWTTEEIATLRRYADAGLTVPQAAVLFDCNQDRIRGAADRHDIKFVNARPGPKPDEAPPPEVVVRRPRLAVAEVDARMQAIREHLAAPQKPRPKQPWTSIIDRVPDPLLAVRRADRRPAVADTALPG